MLDARKLGDGGIGVYLENLIGALSACREVRLTLLGRGAQIAAYAWSGAVDVIEENAKPYSVDELLWMPRRLPSGSCHLFHAPHYTLPLGIKVPAVVTIHDLIHINAPQRPYYPWLARPLIRSALRRAKRVVAVSRSTLKEVGELVRGEAGIMDKLRVVPNAVDRSFLDLAQDSGYLDRHFDLRAPYLLAVVSMLKPHKGVADLLSAFARLKACSTSVPAGVLRELRELRLVLVGKGAVAMTGNRALSKQAAQTPGLVHLGCVSKKALAHLYRYALAVVVPSTAEGFCLPALEAKAFGAAVLARPLPALRELLDQDDFICRDFSPQALAEALEKMIFTKLAGPAGADPTRRLIRTEFLERYGFSALAEKMLTIYREVLQE